MSERYFGENERKKERDKTMKTVNKVSFLYNNNGGGNVPNGKSVMFSVDNEKKIKYKIKLLSYGDRLVV